MITHTLKLEEINKGFDLMHAGEVDQKRRRVLNRAIFPAEFEGKGAGL